MNKARTAVTAATALTLALGTLACTPTGAAEAPSGVVATADTGVTHAQNERVPEGAVWTQHYFPSSDGSDVELHADVLLPEGLADGERVPVVLSAGTYFSHAGEQGDERFPHTGPSDRFSDLVTDGGLLDRGYALVLVDLRGYGGSSGCLDLTGPGEQADVRAAIDWAASRPWSTGAVGMYGKSYDAITALMGNNLRHDALRGVVAMEPIWDIHRNLYSNGLPRQTGPLIAQEYNSYAQIPPMPDDDPRYRENAEYEKTHPECLLLNQMSAQIADPRNQYWRDRDAAANAEGTDTPLMLMQGFLEWNTEAEGMAEFLDHHNGPQRGWLGQWDHVRGNELAPDGRLATGRDGWLGEVLAFYDEHLKGVAPAGPAPAFAVQDSTGAWRAQETWPVVDQAVTLPVGGGTYVDDGADADITAGVPPTLGEGTNSTVSWSEPLPRPVRITGTPRVALAAQGFGNLSVQLYDVSPDGTAVLVDEQAALVQDGPLDLELRSTDWVLPAGHHLAVRFGTVAPTVFGDWLDAPSRREITIRDARLDLALDDPADDTATDGGRSVWLDGYLAVNTRPAAVGTPTFTLPVLAG